ncbi:MAG: flavin reductase family protein [Acidiferrobacterales bacterium]|nr:flavin reductase family protein [Acidiferrobacterales bacterium]
MQINFAELSANQRYHLLTQTVIPRPIAWVLSSNDDGSLNLAPFSFFNAMCSEPALLALSIGQKESGVPKDTARNLLSGREFIVHIANTEQADALTKSAATLAYGESEVELAEMELTEWPMSALPRLAACDIAYQCKLYDHHKIGPKKQIIVYAEVISLFLSDAVSMQNDKRISVDANKVDPLARLGAAQYAPIGQAFSIKRPN